MTVSFAAKAEVRGHLMVGGEHKDFELVRSHLVELMGERPEITFDTVSDFSAAGQWQPEDFLLSYAANLVPTADDQESLRSFVLGGARWFALHGTNAAMDPRPQGVVPRHEFPILVEVIGSEVIAHPREAPIDLHIVDPAHPAVSGMTDFTVTDQLLLLEMDPAVHPIIESHFLGIVPYYTTNDWTSGDGRRVVMYERTLGNGAVLYLSLGHARTPTEEQIRDYGLVVERGSWPSKDFARLMRNGIAWAAELPPQ